MVAFAGGNRGEGIDVFTEPFCQVRQTKACPGNILNDRRTATEAVGNIDLHMTHYHARMFSFFHIRTSPKLQNPNHCTINTLESWFVSQFLTVTR
jgi:hypothetical protein